jgi:hypothetical protein
MASEFKLKGGQVKGSPGRKERREAERERRRRDGKTKTANASAVARHIGKLGKQVSE